MENHQAKYQTWLQTASRAELVLYETVLELDRAYFGDMMFADNSIVRPFLEYEVLEGGSSMQYCEEMPFSYTMIDANYYTFHIGNLQDGVAAETNHESRSVIFSPAYSENTAIVLHEITHIHESLLPVSLPLFRDILLYSLQNDLSGKVPDLDKRIIQHAHLIPGMDITAQGGSHSLLFFLKTLDLDIRCGYPLGTICGYGRDD